MGDGQHHPERHPFPQPPSRRSFLKAGAGVAALSATDSVRALATSAHPTAEAIIVLWLQGGLSHVDTFDPKPDVSGFRAIPASVDGVFFSELLPRTAALMDKLCVLRSMSHDHGTHERATHAMLTGRDLGEGVTHPCFLSVLSQGLAPRNEMPVYVADPGTSHTARLGYLGAGSARNAVTPVRMDVVSATNPTRHSATIDRANVRARQLYGPSPLGNRLRRARRLVEAGVRCVVVDDAGWDDHDDIESAYRRRVPALDRAFAGLIRDLTERDMLARTLVLLLTEFGRAANLNTAHGRTHNPHAFSVVLAGGGIPGGRVIGATDATGTHVVHEPFRPHDLAATVLQRMGTHERGTSRHAGT